MSQLLHNFSRKIALCRFTLEVLATEIFTARNNLSPPAVQNIFRTTEPAYSLRRDTIFERGRIQTQ